MEIYLLRHGIAEEHSADGSDATRRLTEEGRARLRRVLERANAAGVAPTQIISSPLRRALETAEIAAHGLGYLGKIARSADLEPGASPQQVWSLIREHRDEDSLLLTGHEPLFSAATSFLLGSTRQLVHFRKGALVRIDLEAGSLAPAGILQWMITAKLA